MDPLPCFIVRPVGHRVQLKDGETCIYYGCGKVAAKAARAMLRKSGGTLYVYTSDGELFKKVIVESPVIP